ncbi:MAG: thioredoxin family protein [Wenzhouxiangella sp.]
MLRRTFCALILAITLPASVGLAAESLETFSQERLHSLKAEGQAVLVEVYAEWCSTCRRQSPIVSELLEAEEFAHITGLKLDWDGQRDEALALGANRQSTLILFHGMQKVDSSIGETDPERLQQFLAQVNASLGK